MFTTSSTKIKTFHS